MGFVGRIRIHAYLPAWEVQKLRSEMFTSDYGFIVDYLAEVLKELRKEDHNQAYTRFFRLSDVITTRDKTAIEKTFSGLVKVIYPDGIFSKEEARELLEFAIECRKRVKDQLCKMDETFNDGPVVFDYTDLEDNVTSVQTLEFLEFGNGTTPETANEELLDENLLEAVSSVPKKALTGFHRIIRDNQSNISYRQLFGDYLAGATNIIVKDPYIRLPYQMRNFLEFCRLVAETKPQDQEVRIHLVTNNNVDYIENAKEGFAELIESLASLDIDLSYEFSDIQHDRSIELNNGWKIILGRGLDIWQKTNGRFDIAEYYQEKRLCKEFEITVIGG